MTASVPNLPGLAGGDRDPIASQSGVDLAPFEVDDETESHYFVLWRLADRGRGQGADDRRTEPRRQESRERHDAEHGLRPQELQPAQKQIYPLERHAARPHLEREPEQRSGRARGADGLRRRDVRHQRPMDLCHRRRDRPSDLANAGEARGRHHTRGHHARRGDDLQRQGLPRHRRQPRALRST